MEQVTSYWLGLSGDAKVPAVPGFITYGTLLGIRTPAGDDWSLCEPGFSDASAGFGPISTEPSGTKLRLLINVV